MSKSLSQAVSETLPVLQQIRSGFGPSPTASLAALEKLRSLRPPAPTSSRGETAIPEKRFSTLDELREAAQACTKCPHLVSSRTQVVFGVGNPKAELMLVGEAPGADEDRLGEPFVGRAGELLDKILLAMGYTREDIYIANILKCRPDMPTGESGNRKPSPEEMNTCLPWLEEQIALINPRAIVALGAVAVTGLLNNTQPVGRLRGHWQEFRNIPVMPTYHPAYLLRNQSNTEKRKVWEDMLQVLERLGKTISKKQRGFFAPKSS